MFHYSVIFYSADSNHTQSVGLCKSISEAKNWMANKFNERYKELKNKGIIPRWSWNERTSKCLGSCNIENIGTWKIVKFVEDK